MYIIVKISYFRKAFVYCAGTEASFDKMNSGRRKQVTELY
jgi:hypothetical protein